MGEPLPGEQLDGSAQHALVAGGAADRPDPRGTATPRTPANLATLGNPPAGTVLRGTMGRARVAVDNSRLILDRTRGGTGFPLQ